VGLVPMGSLYGAAANYLKLRGFNENQIIENRLLGVAAGRSTLEPDLDFGNMSLRQFAAHVASKDPVPGGGSVSAYCGALAASLVSMVCQLTIGKKGYESVSEKASMLMRQAAECSEKLQVLATKDAQAYLKVRSAYSLPKDTEGARQFRDNEITAAFRGAIEIPTETMELCDKVMTLASQIKEIGNRNARSDAETATELAKAALRGAWSNVRINLETLKGEKDYSNQILLRLEPILKKIA
jgi:formiminotetrahydrofolate cyclodeaminase